jgi:predicted NBD/HSP70 family sugar kinase
MIRIGIDVGGTNTDAVLMDGKTVDTHRSEGYAHATKRWFSLGVGTTAWIDEVKVWKFR